MIYDRLKKENPGVLNKLVAVGGDIEQSPVITRDKDRDKVLEEVSVVFHLAASVKTDSSLTAAVKTNTKGTLNLLEYCKTFKQLKAFVHVSTTVCQCEVYVLEEKYYPPPTDPYKILNLVSSVDSSSFQAMTPGILGEHPNSYTFSKNLAESIVNEFSKDLPTVTVRISTVSPSMYEPVPGWVDSYNGPVGILVGTARGIIKSVLCNSNNRAEIMPVDLAINSIISITANHSRLSAGDKRQDCYNITSSEFFPVTWGDWFKHGSKQFARYPLEAGLWYPGYTVRSNVFIHAMVVLILQTIPAYFIDFVFLLLHKKSFLVHIQNNISSSLGYFRYISTRNWNIKTQKGITQQIRQMHPEDKKIFYIDNVDKDIDQYMLKVILGARQYCAKEPLSTLTKAKIQHWLLFFLHLIARAMIYYFIFSSILNLIETLNPSFKFSEHGLFDHLMQMAVS